MGDLFYIEGTKSLDSNAIEFVKKGINFVGRTFENNGIQGKIEKRTFEPNEPFTITATVIGNYKYVKYQKEPYYCSQNINKLSPKPIIEKWNEKTSYFLITNIQKFVSQYNGQQGGYKLTDINNHKIQLPVKNGKINFDFMESFIAELEAYLQVTGLKDYNLTEKEKQALDNLNKFEFKEYGIEKDLFELQKIKNMLSKQDLIINGIYPAYSSEINNGGVIGYTNFPEFICDNENNYYVIFGDHTKSMNIAKTNFSVLDNVKVLKPKSLTEKVTLYIFTLWSKQIPNLGYARHWKLAKQCKIKLPTKNGEIDFEFMETFISAIQKIVIKNVVLYSEQKINTTKQIINKTNN